MLCLYWPVCLWLFVCLPCLWCLGVLSHSSGLEAGGTLRFFVALICLPFGLVLAWALDCWSKQLMELSETRTLSLLVSDARLRLRLHFFLSFIGSVGQSMINRLSLVSCMTCMMHVIHHPSESIHRETDILAVGSNWMRLVDWLVRVGMLEFGSSGSGSWKRFWPCLCHADPAGFWNRKWSLQGCFQTGWGLDRQWFVQGCLRTGGWLDRQWFLPGQLQNCISTLGRWSHHLWFIPSQMCRHSRCSLQGRLCQFMLWRFSLHCQLNPRHMVLLMDTCWGHLALDCLEFRHVHRLLLQPICLAKVMVMELQIQMKMIGAHGLPNNLRNLNLVQMQLRLKPIHIRSAFPCVQDLPCPHHQDGPSTQNGCQSGSRPSWRQND